VIVRVESKSPSRDLAKNALEGFIQGLDVIESPDAPGPPKPGVPRQPKTQSL
jgi:hypothetical protein